MPSEVDYSLVWLDMEPSGVLRPLHMDRSHLRTWPKLAIEPHLTFFYSFFLLMFKYSCLHFPTTTFPCPTHPHHPPSPPTLSPISPWLHPCCVPHTRSFTFLSFLSHIISLSPPLWLQFVVNFNVSVYVLHASLFC